MIGALLFFGIALWFNWYIGRVLYVAMTRGYVMALTRPFVDTVETPQYRHEKPLKFWANVIVTLMLSPIAVSGLWISVSDLWAAAH